MIREAERVARKAHRCERCTLWIRRGESYREYRLSPNHEGMGYQGWWTSRECGDCAEKMLRPLRLRIVVEKRAVLA